MQKLFYILATVFFMATNVLANDCQIKPTLKEYQPMASATFPVTTFTGIDMKVEQPVRVGVNDSPVFFFTNKKLLTFRYWDHLYDGLKIDDFYLKLFGAIPIGNDSTIIEQYRKTDTVNCNNPVTEIKLNNDNFRAFMHLVKSDRVNVYLIPIEQKGYLYSLQFRGYTLDEVGQIVSTVNK
ncbi:hypothetical protein MTZ49_06420 [Entomomonas sp. E2T0]|uniref:hypothetical protein n=1 Tax=Entomomonas sp. E2T0 TaxID=2930213 RepID=UPI0022285321|nr:hypothetical protein [Entomomonas sp. E2T0]UYZ85183.1 hypothetical protein MTZ49_06420 [Entomomonas sp. E2T0]